MKIWFLSFDALRTILQIFQLHFFLFFLLQLYLLDQMVYKSNIQIMLDDFLMQCSMIF